MKKNHEIAINLFGSLTNVVEMFVLRTSGDGIKEWQKFLKPVDFKNFRSLLSLLSKFSKLSFTEFVKEPFVFTTKIKFHNILSIFKPEKIETKNQERKQNLGM